jgi:antirestriction protein ArdC
MRNPDPRKKEMKETIYETITNQIIAAIEAGAGAYKMPWHQSGQDITNPHNVVSNKSYRGLNVVTLWMIAEARGFKSGTWATYQQWRELGCQVRKGEKSASVFFWKNLSKQDGEDESPDEQKGARFVARAYNVFNAEQVDGYKGEVVPVLSEEGRVANAEAFFAAIPAKIEHGGNLPFFHPEADFVQMVPFEQFKSARGYYSVLAHELTHWSGGKARLDRDLKERFGSEAYAVEELIAELGAAFIGAQLGIGVDPRTDHAPYIASWLKALKNDPRAIFTAASKAQAAADYLFGFGRG